MLNLAEGAAATIPGGIYNTAYGARSTVLGGYNVVVGSDSLCVGSSTLITSDGAMTISNTASSFAFGIDNAVAINGGFYVNGVDMDYTTTTTTTTTTAGSGRRLRGESAAPADAAQGLEELRARHIGHVVAAQAAKAGFDTVLESQSRQLEAVLQVNEQLEREVFELEQKLDLIDASLAQKVAQ